MTLQPSVDGTKQKEPDQCTEWDGVVINGLGIRFYQCLTSVIKIPGTLTWYD